MRVLVTGAGGFVGPHVVDELRHRGNEVVPLVGPFGDSGAGTLVDLRDPEATTAAVRSSQPDAVVHLAAKTEPKGMDALADMLDNNVRCAANVLEAVRGLAPSARVLVVSSSAVYGQVPAERNPIAEREPVSPVLPYGASKAAVEAVGSVYAALGMDVVTVRAFNLAGPGQSRSFVPGSFARQIARIKAGLEPAILDVGPLDTVRDLTDVRDAARAFAMCLEQATAPGPFNVCSGIPRPIGGVLDDLLRLAGVRAELRVGAGDRGAPGLNVRYQCGDRQAIGRAVGWEPEVAWETTLKDVLQEWHGRLSLEKEA